MEQEIWRNIPNSKFYAISSLGKVKRLTHIKWNPVNKSYSTFKERILSISYNNSKNYGRICIVFNNSTKKVCGIHRLVAESFIENFKNLPQVNHKDGDKINNKLSNLEWCSQAENMQHRIHELHVKPWKIGEESNFTKLTEEQVKSIPDLLARGISKVKIGEMFNVKPNTITEITSGRSWKHLNLF